MTRVNLYQFLSRMNSISAVNTYARTTGGSNDSRELISHALLLYRESSQLIDEIAEFGNFAILWPRVRCWLPLQFRLCAEQVMWDRGGDWRRYVSGFKAIDTPSEALSQKDKDWMERAADRFSGVDGRSNSPTITPTRMAQLIKRRNAASRRIR